HAADQAVSWVIADRNRLPVGRSPQVGGDRLANDGGHRDATTLGGVLQVAVDSLREPKIGRDVTGHSESQATISRYHYIEIPSRRMAPNGPERLGCARSVSRALLCHAGCRRFRARVLIRDVPAHLMHEARDLFHLHVVD